MIVLYCMDNQWLSYDPFARFEMKKEEIHPTFLTKEEIQRIVEKEISIERLRQVRDVYIFCCFTGLAYADVEKLKRTIKVSEKGREFPLSGYCPISLIIAAVPAINQL